MTTSAGQPHDRSMTADAWQCALWHGCGRLAAWGGRLRVRTAARALVAILTAMLTVPAAIGCAPAVAQTGAETVAKAIPQSGGPDAGAAAATDASGSEAGDPQHRAVLRFVTEGDFPPFNYTDAEGVLTGFNVDLARAICLEVNAACDIKQRPWDEHYAALAKGEADAAIAARRLTWSGVAQVAFSDRYFHTPGRFAAKRDGVVIDTVPENLEGKTVGVARGTAHEAYLKAFFHESAIKTFDTVDLAREALADGKIENVFDDGIGLSFWINGTNSRQCCELKGGAFLEPRYFGDGLAIALPKSDPALRVLMNAALAKVYESGRFEELLQRYFPSRIY